MARSTNFFGLRRGSTKSLTFQVYRGQQITKDRVTNVSNPQSTAQMQQRLKVPIVASARALLKTLVDHSFEGVTYGEPSLKKFSSLNLAKGALTVTQYVPKTVMDCGLSDLIISDGSLPSVYSVFRSLPGNGGDVSNPVLFPFDKTKLAAFFNDLKLDKKKYEAGAEVDAKLITAIISAIGSSVQAGDQLTFLVEAMGDNYTFEEAAGEEVVGHYHRFVVSRLMLDTENGDSRWKLVQAIDGTGDNPQMPTSLSITDGYMQIRLYTEPKDWWMEDSAILTNIFRDGTMVSCNDGNGEPVEAICTILSRQQDNVWRRSSNRLLVNPNADKSTQDFNAALYSYIKSSSASTRYLNSGVDGVDITGGQTKGDAATDTSTSADD